MSGRGREDTPCRKPFCGDKCTVFKLAGALSTEGFSPLPFADFSRKRFEEATGRYGPAQNRPATLNGEVGLGCGSSKWGSRGDDLRVGSSESLSRDDSSSENDDRRESIHIERQFPSRPLEKISTSYLLARSVNSPGSTSDSTCTSGTFSRSQRIIRTSRVCRRRHCRKERSIGIASANSERT